MKSIQALEKEVAGYQKQLTVLTARTRRLEKPALFQSPQGKQLAKEIAAVNALKNSK